MSLSLDRPPRLRRPASVAHRLAWQLPLGAGLATVSVVVLGAGFDLVGFLYLALVTPELCRIDVADHRLPNALVVPGIAVAAIGVVFEGLAEQRMPAEAAVAAVAVGGFFLLLAVAGGVGFGDVKLSLALALAGGGASATIVLGTVVLGFIGAGVVALTAITARGAAGSLAFGPYLLGGFWASVAALPLLG